MSSLNSDDLQRLFKKLDQNHDGVVSVDELQWLLDAMNVGSSADELECLTGKTSLNLMEFINFYNVIATKDSSETGDGPDGEGKESESDLLKAFGVFDKNNDGFISFQELYNALSKLNLLDERRGMDIKRIIKAYDANSDGFLDFQEFKKMMST